MPLFAIASEMLPVPLAENPVMVTAEAVAVQAKVVPVTIDVGFNIAVEPEQIVCVNGEFVTVGVGLTVTTKLTGITLQDNPGPTGVTA